MQRARKIATVILLVVFVWSNLLDSFSYVFAEENDFWVENWAETTMNENSDGADGSDDVDVDNSSDSDDADGDSRIVLILLSGWHCCQSGSP